MGILFALSGWFFHRWFNKLWATCCFFYFFNSRGSRLVTGLVSRLKTQPLYVTWNWNLERLSQNWSSLSPDGLVTPPIEIPTKCGIRMRNTVQYVHKAQHLVPPVHDSRSGCAMPSVFYILIKILRFDCTAKRIPAGDEGRKKVGISQDWPTHHYRSCSLVMRINRLFQPIGKSIINQSH